MAVYGHASLAGIGHQLLSPNTYPCQLRAPSHGILAEGANDGPSLRPWIFPASFCAATSCVTAYQTTGPVPAIFRLVHGRPQVSTDSASIATFSEIADFEALIHQNHTSSGMPEGGKGQIQRRV